MTPSELAKSYFPLGVATGVAYCNRTDERSELLQNVRSGLHTWLAARRRTGKTSLVTQVAIDGGRGRSPVIAVEADLIPIYSMENFSEVITAVVAESIPKIVPKSRLVAKHIGSFFRRLRPELSVDEEGVRVRLFTTTDADPKLTVQGALAGLEKAAATHRRRVMFVLDEFQQLASLKNHIQMEGTIRSFAQRCKHVSFVFAGSEHHLLDQMFEDPDRPLYRLCERMALAPISHAKYAQFLDEAACARWSSPIDSAAIDMLLEVSLRQAAYLNPICHRLWRRRRPPSADVVQQEWSGYVVERKTEAAAKIAKCSPNQRAFLFALANNPGAGPTSKLLTAQAGLSTSSAAQARDGLMRDDLVEQDETGAWRVANPLVAAYLTRRTVP